MVLSVVDQVFMDSGVKYRVGFDGSWIKALSVVPVALWVQLWI